MELDFDGVVDDALNRIKDDGKKQVVIRDFIEGIILNYRNVKARLKTSHNPNDQILYYEYQNLLREIE